MEAITLVEETGSTNADLAAGLRCADRPREGQWLVARRQTAGRGRQGRAWYDGAGNFMGSSVVAVRADDPPPASLGFVAALAVREVAAEYLPAALDLRTKWPNDVLLAGAKLSGILLEMVEGHVVVGTGVNLAHAPALPDRETAAIADYGPAPALETFAGDLARCFARRLAQWRGSGLAPIFDAFVKVSIHCPGAPITVHDSDASVVSGAFAGLDPADGALRLRLADGSERVIRAGDVS